MRLRLLLSALPFLFLFCKNTPRTAAPGGENVVELDAGFVKFYEQFHKDSAFQMAHIQFPMPGRGAQKMPDGSYSLIPNWTAGDWKIMSLPPLNTGEFRRDFIPVSPELMVEKIVTVAQIGYLIERRWAKLGGEWMLIYYSAGMAQQ